MMTELKTLKDLEKIKLLAKGQPKECAGELAVEERKLREEAIKLFKTKHIMMMTAQEFIHWFFNLTEKDLK